MKLLLAALLLTLLSYTSYAQTGWPHNPKTGKVEFTGTLPWPKDIKSEAQRRALVRRWYLAKLTDLSPSEVEKQVATNRTNGLLTYADLPRAAVLRQGKDSDGYILGYLMRLTASSVGLDYKIDFLSFDKLSGVEENEPTPIEELQLKPNSPEKAALAGLRKRLTVALAGW